MDYAAFAVELETCVILRQSIERIKSQNWSIVIIEVLVLVVGIFIGLQVDDWNQSRKDVVEERLYLKELLEDLEANRAELLETISAFGDSHPCYDGAVGAVGNGHRLTGQLAN